MRRHYQYYRNNGASESIGFLLIFTIVMMGIGLVTLYGYPMLLQQQTGADEQIMEKNMIVLQNDFKGLVYKSVPYEETALKIGSGSLELNNFRQAPHTHGPAFDVSENAGSDLMPTNNTGDLRYLASASQAMISLENGAVVKQDLSGGATGSIMLAQPRWFFDDQTKTMVINLVWINSTAYMSHSGIGTVQMKLGPTEYVQVDYPPNNGKRITVTYTPDTSTLNYYASAWKDYMEKQLNMQCGNPSPTAPMSCTTINSVQTIVVKKTEVMINSI